MLHHELMNADERELLDNLLVLLSTHQQAQCKLMVQVAGVGATTKDSFAIDQSMHGES